MAAGPVRQPARPDAADDAAGRAGCRCHHGSGAVVSTLGYCPPPASGECSAAPIDEHPMRPSILAVILAIAPFTAGSAQPPASVITRLAEGWSGQTSPRCTQHSTGGRLVDGQRDPWACEWSATTGGTLPGHVWGTVDVPERPSMVMWDRPSRDVGDADRVIDSVRTSLAARGLREYPCGETDVPAGHVRATSWLSPDLFVHLSRIAPPAGAPRIFIVAVDDPAQVPHIFRCDLGDPKDSKRPPAG